MWTGSRRDGRDPFRDKRIIPFPRQRDRNRNRYRIRVLNHWIYHWLLSLGCQRPTSNSLKVASHGEISIFFPCCFFLHLDVGYVLQLLILKHYKTQGRVFSNRGRMMRMKKKENLSNIRNLGFILIFPNLWYFDILCNFHRFIYRLF